MAREALSVFEEVRDEIGQARAWSLLSATAWARGRMVEVRRAADRGLVHARHAQHERVQARLLDFANSGLVWGPAHVDEVTGRAEQTLAWARANGNRYLEAITLGFPIGLSTALRGQTAEARRQISDAKTLLDGMNERWVRPLTAARLAAALCEQGRWNEAVHSSTLSEELAPTDSGLHQGWWRAVRATLLGHESDAGEVCRLATEAKAALRRTDWFHRADIYAVLAEALLGVGRKAPAREHAHEALRVYEQKGHVIGAANARALLANS
jgi:hypothetical protein